MWLPEGGFTFMRMDISHATITVDIESRGGGLLTERNFEYREEFYRAQGHWLSSTEIEMTFCTASQIEPGPVTLADAPALTPQSTRQPTIRINLTCTT